jgi:hypothetical protein
MNSSCCVDKKKGSVSEGIGDFLGGEKKIHVLK